MHTVLVYVHVHSENIEQFIDETKKNAQQSRDEPGVIRFDVFQEKTDQTKFLLIEIYQTPEDQALHKETSHYIEWRDNVAQMMAEPRTGVPHIQLF